MTHSVLSLPGHQHLSDRTLHLSRATSASTQDKTTKVAAAVFRDSHVLTRPEHSVNRELHQSWRETSVVMEPAT